MGFLQILPLAFVMIAGPQILSSIFLATTEDWRHNSAAFVFGAALSITTFVTLAFFVLNGHAGGGAENEDLYWVVLVLLAAAAVHVYLTRKTSEPPKWMGKLQTATPGFSFKLGALLLGVFPTDILTSAAVGTYLAGHGDAWWHSLGFIGLTLLFLALPSLALLLFGTRAQELMPKARNWMNANSWVVNEIVIGLFVALTISNLS